MDNDLLNNNPLAEQEHVEQDEFLQEVKWQEIEISDDQWLDVMEPYVRPDYTLSYNGTPFAPLGGIHALTGQPGHGKTATFSMFIAALLGGNYGELKSEIAEPRVLYVDTEMERCNTVLVAKRIYEMAGRDTDFIKEHLRVLRLRDELKATDRWRKILKAIWIVQPQVVFIDGIIDITQDFNDNKECQDLIYQIMDTATHFNVSLWCLLHQNPGSTKMVGHAGSFLERKATDVFMTKKDKDGSAASFEISQIKARGRDVETIPFTIEDDEHHYGIPRIGQKSSSSDEPAASVSIEEVENYMRDIADKITWPATNAQIEDALNVTCLLTNHGTRYEVIQKARNRNWLRLDHKEGNLGFWNIDVPPF